MRTRAQMSSPKNLCSCAVCGIYIFEARRPARHSSLPLLIFFSLQHYTHCFYTNFIFLSLQQYTHCFDTKLLCVMRNIGGGSIKMLGKQFREFYKICPLIMFAIS